MVLIITEAPPDSGSSEPEPESELPLAAGAPDPPEGMLIRRALDIVKSPEKFEFILQSVLDLLCRENSWPEAHVYECRSQTLKLAPFWFDRNVVDLEQIQKLVTRRSGQLGTPLAQSVLSSGQITLIDDPRQLASFKKEVSPEIVQALGIPILVEGKVKLILEFLSDRKHVIDSGLRQDLQEIAALLGECLTGPRQESPTPKPSDKKVDQQAPPVMAPHEELGTPASLETSVLVVGEADEELEGLLDTLARMQLTPEVSNSGDAALEKLREHHFDLVLTRLKTEDMGGAELAQEIRRDQDLSDSRIIAVTGTILPDMRSRVRDSGFDGFLLLPIEESAMRELVASVKPSSSFGLR